MLRRPFYNIETDTYLFRDRLRNEKNRDPAEEPIRQWCAFELMRSYGIAISDIEFEHQVRVGSKKYGIDILVKRHGIPFVVIECKAPKDTNPDKGMEQAISYAIAQNIQAEFAVYTNGTIWHTQRRVQGIWIVVPDLPRQVDHHATVTLTDLLRGLHYVAPLLYKLDESLEDDIARRFLNVMQRFFCGKNLLTSDSNQELLIATDNLLRVLSRVDAHPQYRFGKLEIARKHFESYRKQAGYEFEILRVNGNEPLYQNIQYFYSSLLGMIDNAQDLPGCDLFLLRVNAALLEYGQLQRNPKMLYPRINPSLHRALRDYLNFTMMIHLNTSLSDPIDSLVVEDVRLYCHQAWTTFDVKDHITFREFLFAWVAWIRHRICFWNRKYIQ